MTASGASFKPPWAAKFAGCDKFLDWADFAVR
jgi:hypothetical protein